MNGAIPLLHPFAFIAFSGTTSPSTIYIYIYIYICLRSMNFLKNHFQLNLCSVKSLNAFCLIKFARMWKEVIVD